MTHMMKKVYFGILCVDCGPKFDECEEKYKEANTKRDEEILKRDEESLKERNNRTNRLNCYVIVGTPIGIAVFLGLIFGIVSTV